MNKIIVVAYHLGRIGSSAMMGLLREAGINVGQKHRLNNHGIINPKGFFELKLQQEFLSSVYKGIYPGVTSPPSLEVMSKIGIKYYKDYEELIQREFGCCFPIAIKSQRLLTLPLLHQLKEDYQIKLLIMERKLEDQVNSTLRVWKRSNQLLQKSATREFVFEYLTKWKAFSHKVEQHYKFPTLHVSFNELIADPVEVSKSIFDFIEEDYPDIQQIKSWIDPSLVNRSKLPQ